VDVEHLEKKAKISRRHTKIQKTVLGVIGVAGAITLAAIAPQMLQALPRLMGKERYRLTFHTKTAVGRLFVKGYVKKNKNGFIEITENGRRHLDLELARAEAPASRKKRWDKRYRLVMFDIPQKRRGVRDRLRALMRDFGFMRLQNSVWVSPYDCEELVALVKAELRIGNDVLYAIVDQIGNETRIKEHFGLR
jgi:CRISPR-associated endonuclease Cas2